MQPLVTREYSRFYHYLGNISEEKREKKCLGLLLVYQFNSGRYFTKLPNHYVNIMIVCLLIK